MQSLIGRRFRPEPQPPRRDPAPSRWAYRFQRLWLTPLFRSLLRTGLPAFTVVLLAGLYFGNAERRAVVVNAVAELRQQIESRPEFMVTMLQIDGASPPLAKAIRQALALKLPQSSFDLNLEALRRKAEQLDAVASTEVQVKGGGVLQVTVHARQGAVVWRSRKGLEMLDATGHRVAALTTRAARADLPLIAGEAAEKAVPEALKLIAAAGPIRPRIRGLVRMGARRWDVVLDRGQRILLPEARPVRALERVIALDQAQDLLSRDIVAVDMRNEQRPTLRLTPQAVAALRKMRETQAGALSQ
ncbi:cell division protein FtsQ/DivIB [Acidimangrovimonas pyrenivorans]|uniref:Cell division protein FtsQ n=1 Tax=Acidimangrovimonas pyrenivorans TaxID=2030798 RepID=A0ABV7AH35_9RHOB